MTSRERLAAARLYAIVDLGYVAADRIAETTTELIAGGADLIQLRAKGYEVRDILAMAKLLRPLCSVAGVPFIVNDHPGIAREVAADGVHLGQDDGNLQRAREETGGTLLVGRSTHGPDQARQAVEEGADYIGFGPLFPTPTKEGRPGIGLENIAAVESEVGSRIPVFCIGGIKKENLAGVLRAGARRVVVVSGLLQAPDVAAAVAEVKAELHHAD